MIESGFYYLYSDKEEEPTLVHAYYSNHSKALGLGFNTRDGGGFLPLNDFPEDSYLLPVMIEPYLGSPTFKVQDGKIVPKD